MGKEMKYLAVVILAAGKGVRMKSNLAKVLHPLKGRPMIHYVVDLAEKLSPEKIVVVVGHQKEKVIETLRGRKAEFAVQAQQLGTAHALLQTAKSLDGFDGVVLVLSGDVPLLRQKTILDLIELFKHSDLVAAFLTTEMDNPFGYGRVLRDKQGLVDRIVEEKDATPQEKKVREINAGIYLFDKKQVFPLLTEISRDNVQGEFYLTDLVAIFKRQGMRVSALKVKNPIEVKGVNSIEELRALEKPLS